jgi:tRNA pseudouridine38-40 synthase
MNRYFTCLSFDGTNYHGWQIQHNSRTVQKVLNEAFSLLLREEVRLTGCGRTDTGVHASEYFAHFETLRDLTPAERKNLVFKLNSYLDDDIGIHSVFPVGARDHARFSATSRTYKYFIHTLKDPFLVNRSFYLYGKIDIDRMNQGAAFLTRTRDFTSFSKAGTNTLTNECEVTAAGWEKQGYMLVFTITANRFLRNMVRAIVGTLLEIGAGKISPDELGPIVESKDRSHAGESVPACGLYLASVEYPGNLPHIDHFHPGVLGGVKSEI